MSELQKSDLEIKKPKTKDLFEDWENVEDVSQHWDFLYIPEIKYSKLISCHNDNLLAKHLGINKTKDLVARK